jgi:hypothetical protein
MSAANASRMAAARSVAGLRSKPAPASCSVPSPPDEPPLAPAWLLLPQLSLRAAGHDEDPGLNATAAKGTSLACGSATPAASSASGRSGLNTSAGMGSNRDRGCSVLATSGGEAAAGRWPPVMNERRAALLASSGRWAGGAARQQPPSSKASPPVQPDTRSGLPWYAAACCRSG